MGSLGLPDLTPVQANSLAVVLSQSGVVLADVQRLTQLPDKIHLIQSRAETYAGRLVAVPGAPALSAPGEAAQEEARILATLAPLHAKTILEARRQAVVRIEEALNAWGPVDTDGGPLAGTTQRRSIRLLPAQSGRHQNNGVLGDIKAPPAPVASAKNGLPFQPARAFSLSHVAAVMERRLAAKEDISEEQYRSMDATAFFAGDETRRMDTLLTRQAADPAQAMLEVISNAQDASNPDNKKVGRFGVGGLQVLGELKSPEDRVVMETSKGDGAEIQLVFWKKNGDVHFDYRLVPSSRRGTRFQVLKPLGEDEATHHRKFLERKLRANDRGRIVWKNGTAVNRPEEFLEFDAPARQAPVDSPAVSVRLGADGYEVEDTGKGMGLKEIFERYLKPYGTDKTVEKNTARARLLHRDSEASMASLGVSRVEIEQVSVDQRRLGLAGDVFIDLPHDTDLSEERGTVSLVPSDQTIDGALRGMRLLIERLTDPAADDPALFRLINSVAAVIRIKQPASDKGVSRGDPKAATDLMWYLRHRLEAGGLLANYRRRGVAFLPNSARWAPLEDLSEKIVFLDDALFAPTASDFEIAEFEPLPSALADQPAWKAFASRSKAEFFTRQLRPDGALAIVSDGVVVLDKSIASGTGDIDVLIARVEREMLRSASPAAPRARTWRTWVRRRFLAPLLFVAAIAAAPPLYSAVSDLIPVKHAVEWTFHSQGRYQMSGNPNPIRNAHKHDNAKPAKPYGTYSPAVMGDPYFINAVKTRLKDDGSWTTLESDISHSGASVTGKIDVKYRLYIDSAKQSERLFNRPNGTITNVSVTDEKGNPVKFYVDYDDTLSIQRAHKGVVNVSYRIETHELANDIWSAVALPEIEQRDFPAKWRAVLDPLKNAPDEAKVAAIHRLMGEDFEYHYDKPFSHNGSWGLSASKYLDRGERIPIICNTSSLYYFMMARYVDLPAAYVTLVKGVDGTFYDDVVGHARAMVRVDGHWRTVETTALMPLKSKAPEVIPGMSTSDGDMDSAPWLNLSFLKIASDPLLHEGPLKTIVGLVLFLGCSFGALILTASIVGKKLISILSAARLTRPVRASEAVFGRGSWRWWKWTPLAKSGIREFPASWGSAFHLPQSNWLYLEDHHGRLSAVPIVGSRGVQIIGDRLLYVRRGWPAKRVLMSFDGERHAKITATHVSHRQDLAVLVPQGVLLGSRQYATQGKTILRLDLSAGSSLRLAETGKVRTQAMFLGSRAGVDRIAVRTASILPTKETFRTLAVSGDRAVWEPGEITVRMGKWLKTRSEWLRDSFEAFSAGDRTVYQVVTQGKKNALLTRVFVSGLGEVPLSPGMGDPTTKDPLWHDDCKISAVVGGKIFLSVGSHLQAFDIASWKFVEPELDGGRVQRITTVGADVFAVVSVGGNQQKPPSPSRNFFVDGDGGFLAQSVGVVRAAVRVGDTVYFRKAGSDSILYAAAKEGPVVLFSLKSSPERRFSLAAARATGLDAALFEHFDDDAGLALHETLILPKNADALADAAKHDAAALAALEKPLREAVALRAATGSREWSIGRTLLSPDIARGQIISPEVMSRLDALVRASPGETARLRPLFEVADRLFRTQGEDADRAVGHLLDIAAAAPEIIDDLRRAVLELVAAPSGPRTEPLDFLSSGEDGRKGLPPLTALFLQMLADGPESLLRRESENAPTAAPSFILDGKGESMSRLIAAARATPEEAMDAAGVAGFSRVFAGLAPTDRADLSSITGVVKNQGLSAPVWIRELVQNARDALREAKRAGRSVAPELALRSYLSEDGARWIVSVRDGGIGMKLSRFLKAMLTPEATTKTLADEVRMFLSMPGDTEEKVSRLLSEFFDDAAAADADLKYYLRAAVAGAPAAAGKAIAEKLSERMKKGGAGFFGIGFFTVFGGGDQVVARTGADGMLYEGAFAPVRDAEGRLVDIKFEHLKAWPDPNGERQGTEVLRVKKVTPENYGRLLIENAYVHIMTGKYVGAVTDVGISLNGAPLHSGIHAAGQLGGLRSRIDPTGRARWTVDELFAQEPPVEGLALIPPEVASALLAHGWNMDFPAATPVVRTRTSLQNPGQFAPAVAALALSAAYKLYVDGKLALPGLPSSVSHWRISPWDSPPPSPQLESDATAVLSGRADAELWRRYFADPRLWAQLMMRVYDTKESVIGEVLGAEVRRALDALRSRGEPARIGTLPPVDSPSWRQEVARLHEEALARASKGDVDVLASEPAATGLARVLGRLASFLDAPPPFVSADVKLWEGLRRCLDEGKAVPLMEALLAAVGRGTDADAVRLFEGWLKGQGAVKELESLFLGGLPRQQAEASLGRMWKAASRERPPLLPLKRS